MKNLTKKQKKALKEIILAAVLILIIELIPFYLLPIDKKIQGIIKFVLFLAPYYAVGGSVLKKAWKGIKKKQPFDECFLMAVATIGAICLGQYTEAVAVMLFYQIGELFQSIAVGKSRKSITDLMDIRPDYANMEVDGQLEQVDPDDVGVGSTIVVKPGEKVPIDGEIVEGQSTLDTAALTGESMPRSVGPKDLVISGCVNQSGLLKIRTTKEFGESTASKILDLVENASSRKSKSENFITKFARFYTPIVVYAALALAILPPIVSLIMGLDANWGTWIYRALTFLVISCPCAIVVSIPLGFFGGLGAASSQGVLIKGSNYMETLAKTRILVFDKTGTITRGNFEVTGIHHSSLEDEKLLELAAHVESFSTHPIAQSLARAYGKEIDQNRVTDLQEVSGHGIVGKVDGKRVAVGNHKLMTQEGVQLIECHSVGTIIHVAIDGAYAGHIVIADQIKPQAKEAMSRLKSIGVKKTVMLTGDIANVASHVASEVGIDEVHAELLPADKVSQVEALIAAKGENETLAFVGDGINDAPVLSRADVGIAMGGLGSDAAIEAADVVLMDDNPASISKAIGIARKCMRIVKENIIFAIGVKLACLLLGALGIANMWVAIFADVGVMVLCVLNAIRVLWVKNIR